LRVVAFAALTPVFAACSSANDRSETETIEPEPTVAGAPPQPFGPPQTTADAPLVLPARFACQAVRDDDSEGSNQYPVPKPPFTPGMFPCTRCHDKPDDFNPTPRTLTAQHMNIQLAHGSREQWCYDCHNPPLRDKLRLAGGRLVGFETSYELCGQCHGEKLRDWRNGIHGRRVGCWNGQREYLLCVNCHNPHAPAFKPMHPLPRPKRPDEIHLDQEHGT
jgi:hypothetical protein